MPSGPEWLWIIIAVAVLFGASRLPLLGRNLGQGIKEFRKGIKEVTSGGDKQAEPGKKGTEAAEPAEAPKATEPTSAERRD